VEGIVRQLPFQQQRATGKVHILWSRKRKVRARYQKVPA
jgi:hypothetical protein